VVVLTEGFFRIRVVVGFGFRDSVGGAHKWLLLQPPIVQGVGFGVPSLGLWASRFGRWCLQRASFGFQVSGFGFQDSGSGGAYRGLFLEPQFLGMGFDVQRVVCQVPSLGLWGSRFGWWWCHHRPNPETTSGFGWWWALGFGIRAVVFTDGFFLNHHLFRDSSFGFQVSGFGFRNLGGASESRGLGFGTRGLGFGIWAVVWVPGFGRWYSQRASS